MDSIRFRLDTSFLVNINLLYHSASNLLQKKLTIIRVHEDIHYVASAVGAS